MAKRSGGNEELRRASYFPAQNSLFSAGRGKRQKAKPAKLGLAGSRVISADGRPVFADSARTD
jgi:hypothetical protein